MNENAEIKVKCVGKFDLLTHATLRARNFAFFKKRQTKMQTRNLLLFDATRYLFGAIDSRAIKLFIYFYIPTRRRALSSVGV